MVYLLPFDKKTLFPGLLGGFVYPTYVVNCYQELTRVP